jgi:protein-tyrosine phosphatase
MIDLHAHVLPGLDDGPRDLAAAVALCARAAADGTQTMVATPHMYNGVYEVTREQVMGGVAGLAAELERQAVPLRVLPGADLHVDEGLPEAVRSGRAVTIADGGKYLLLELDPETVTPGIERLLFQLRLAKVTPIITHPERIEEVQRNPLRMLPLVEAGVPMQITAMSLTGGFGRSAQECAREMVRRRLAHVVASDAHSADGRGPGLSAARRVVEELAGAEEAEAMFALRPKAVIEGRSFALADPIAAPARKTFWQRWLGG